jgi:hypothetical protein
VEQGRDTPPPLAWWASQRVRLPSLLACLGAAIVALLGTRTSLLGAVGIGGGGSAEGVSTWCVPRGLPAPAGADLHELLELHAGVAAVFKFSGGRRYAAGVVTPDFMWSDDLPLRLRASRLADGLWPAGIEMRWWARNYNVVADALAFPGARGARAFFEEASSGDCRRSAAERPALSPPGARNLAWVNPDGAKQDDVFLLRGRRVYRVAAVRLQSAPAMTAPAGRRAGEEVVDGLACALPDAGCPASRGASAVHSRG